MKYRKLGKTGLDVSIIGLGTEYLNRKSKETVVSVISKAIEQGVNYFDIVFTFKKYLDNLGVALKGRRDKAILTGHLGSAETNGHYRLTHDTKECEQLFLKILSRLHTDYIDIVFIQMVNELESVERIMKPGGKMELAKRLQKEGKARFIGISGHKVPAAMKVIESGEIDVLMFPINLAWDFTPGRKEIFRACVRRKLGLVAMKPFAGGRIFQKKNSVSITSAQCINYVLSQSGVSTTVPGVKTVKELNTALHFLNASKEEKDFKSIIKEFQQDLEGNCVYCNHCLPCPVGIDIGRTISLVDKLLSSISDKRKAHYKSFKTKINFYYPGRIHSSRTDYKGYSTRASACTQCGVCIKRCPFGVNVIAKMKQAVKLFECT